MTIIRSNQSTFLAARAKEAQNLGTSQPKAVALPGAKQAVAHDMLLAHHDSGHDQHEIVRRVNARWEREHADRLTAHREWTTGPYANAIEELRRAKMEEAAEDLRRRARLEQLLAGED